MHDSIFGLIVDDTGIVLQLGFIPDSSFELITLSISSECRSEGWFAKVSNLPAEFSRHAGSFVHAGQFGDLGKHLARVLY